MLSTSHRMRWLVDLHGRRHVVDASWPGFSNWIAVDGHTVERWRWPSNNLWTWRTFPLAGSSARIIRRRSGLFSFAYELQVDAPGAHVQQVDPWSSLWWNGRV
ncbi:MAG TPA: hypothetical protein PLJ27_12465 [Polyangiaceae bacterium]|nr:hypothetical protein [Polyangiaceae bacterium]HNZ24816.1 hypothetical protein [Polyangiaceae bacterium]HOD22032.1 hypothetical protein [Polyangiaceae bacterium]HOE47999.1 hypothetical protein [Polyangiaceae bacterium]HOH02914.1 hypothetical protein [Polyangiaceae bacterium]